MQAVLENLDPKVYLWYDVIIIIPDCEKRKMLQNGKI